MLGLSVLRVSPLAGFRTSLVVLRFDPFANLERRSGWPPRVITANRTLGSRLAVDSIKLCLLPLLLVLHARQIPEHYGRRNCSDGSSTR